MPGRNTMLEITGKYASAKVFTDDIEEEAVRQIINLLDQPFAEGSHPRFMPDVHAGKGCTIGTTMHVKDKICPNLVGVDISCGMLVTKVPSKDVDFAAFDRIVHQQVPAGRNIHDAAVVSFDELMACGTMAAAKEKGLVRSEGKEYVMKDGDIVLFRFNV